jgi:hypothetical protein
MKLAAGFAHAGQILAFSTPFCGIIRGLRTREKVILSRGDAARLLESLVRERTREQPLPATQYLDLLRALPKAAMLLGPEVLEQRVGICLRMKNGIHWNPINWWTDDTDPRRQLRYFRDEYLVWGGISGDDYTLLCIFPVTDGRDITTQVGNMRVIVPRVFMDYWSSKTILKQHYSRQSESNNFF